MTRWRTRWMWGIGLGTAVVPLDTSVNIAFPAVTTALDLAITDIQWVVIAYVLTYASLMLGLGRIGDIFGHATVLRAGLLWSAVALLLCAAAPTLGSLLICRFLQGIGAALVLSCGAALVTGLYDEDRRGRVLGVYTMTWAIGAALGPWLGGALVQFAGWPSVFWFRAPIALLALALVAGLSAPTRPAGDDKFDTPGAALLAMTLAAMLLAFARIRDIAAVPLGAASVVALIGFLRHTARTATPILDLRVFRVPGFALVNLASVLVSFAAFAVWLLVPFYLAHTRHDGPTHSGAVLATASLGAAVAAPLAGRLIGRLSPHVLTIIGAGLAGAGLALIASWEHTSGAAWLVLALTVQGFGVGLFQLAYTDIVTAAMPSHRRGVAGSLANVTRTIGTVGAASGIMLAFDLLGGANDFAAAFCRTFALAAAITLAIAVVLVMRGRA